MTPEQETEVLHKRLQTSMKRVAEADSHMEKWGVGAVNIMLAISGSCLELNSIMKAMFLAHVEGLDNEFDVLREQFQNQLKSFGNVIETRFGTIKPTPTND